MKLRSGKTYFGGNGCSMPITEKCRICGDGCFRLLAERCCGCFDTRPIQDTYIVYNKPDWNEVSYVLRNYNYCSACKKRPIPTKAAVIDISELKHPRYVSRPTPKETPATKEVRIDFSKMKPKPTSPAIVFQPTPEEKIRNLEKENESLHKMHDDLVANEHVLSDKINDLENYVERMGKVMQKIHDFADIMRVISINSTDKKMKEINEFATKLRVFVALNM